MKDKCAAHRALSLGDPEAVLTMVGLRKTALRIALIEIFANPRAHSQKELVEALEKKGLNGIDRVSIYRNLHQFLEAGIVHEVAANSYVSCQHLSDVEQESHLVLFCSKCKRHEEVCKQSDQ